MISKVKSISLIGLDGKIIEIQTDISNGIPEFEIVGLPDTSVRESKKRIVSAIRNSKMEFPSKKILINLAPANIRKEGSCFDLSIAIGILIANGKIPKVNISILTRTVFIGELSLDGNLNRTRGVLAMCIEAQKMGIKRIILPKANSAEISILKDIEIILIDNLEQVIRYLNGEVNTAKVNYEELKFNDVYDVDFSEIKGQENVKRAMEVSAAGNHNCLMIGSPGAGKTMIAKRLITILPELTLKEKIEISKIYSISGETRENENIFNRPFRRPHHTATIKTIIGGGRIPLPRRNNLSS